MRTVGIFFTRRGKSREGKWAQQDRKGGVGPKKKKKKKEGKQHIVASVIPVRVQQSPSETGSHREE